MVQERVSEFFEFNVGLIDSSSYADVEVVIYSASTFIQILFSVWTGRMPIPLLAVMHIFFFQSQRFQIYLMLFHVLFSIAQHTKRVVYIGLYRLAWEGRNLIELFPTIHRGIVELIRIARPRVQAHCFISVNQHKDLLQNKKTPITMISFESALS